MAAGINTLSARGQSLLSGEPSLLDLGYTQSAANAFDVVGNPSGVINLGTAENQLNASELGDKLRSIAPSTITPASMKYGDVKGSIVLREAIAGFYNDHIVPLAPVEARHVAVVNGASSMVDVLFHSICDEGDGVLLPVPYYGAFDQDLGRRALVSVVPVHASSADGFQLHMANVVEAYNKAKKQGIRIRALLLASPNNPLGQCYPADLLRSLIAFTEAVDIHLVSDEIYMMSDYSADLGLPNTFVSVLSLPARNPDKVHAIWAFSKDFCVSGFRIGVLVTRSQPVYDAVCSLGVFACVPVAMQLLMAHMLHDKAWTNKFISQNHARIASQYLLFKDRLEAMGVRVVPAHAGFFIWVDMRPFLSAPTFDAEMDLWKRLLANGLYIVPGQAFRSPEPGWFRIVIAVPEATANVALDRVHESISTLSSKL